ncbi:MAG: hypothetical protein LQ340_006213 [Diploschistes diacapsis]|nr:MAG: hypothetical protein LQ340_006213 [Diploschistes diacapsis]
MEEPIDSDVPVEEEILTTAAEASRSKTTSTSPKKNAVPLKRPVTVTTAKRPGGPASAATSKSTTTTGRSVALGSTLSKPPTRPPPSSAVRRSIVPASSATPSHRSRSSIGSIEGEKKGSGSPNAEAKRSMVSGIAKRASLTPSAASKMSENRPPTSAAARRIPGSTSSIGEKNIAMSSKDESKPLSDSLRSSMTAINTSRTVRSSTLTKGSSSGLAEGKKRLSTIPASPATQVPLSPTKQERPALGARKSTMSAMTEQRLREFELVQNMLKVAMAQDAADDEVKEEYTKQMDKNLATLKKELQDARRAEGQKPTEPLVPETKPGESDASTSNTLETELRSSKARVAALEAELADAKQIMDKFSAQTEEALKAIDASKEDMQHDYDQKINELTASHAADLARVRTEQKVRDKQNSQQNEKEAKGVADAKKSLIRDHATELDKLKAQHAGELEQLRIEIAEKDRVHKQQAEQAIKDVDFARASARQQGSDEVARLLEEQKEKHGRELNALQAKSEENQKQGLDASSKVSELTSQLTDLRTQLANAEQASADDVKACKAQFEKEINAKDEQIVSSTAELAAVRKELAVLKESHSRELDEVQASSTERIRSAQADHEASRQRLVELETGISATSAEHEELFRKKDAEIQDHVQKVQELEASATVLNQQHKQILHAKDAEKASALQRIQQLEADASFSTFQHAEALAVKESEIEASVQKVKELEKSASSSAAQQAEVMAAKEAETQAFVQRIQQLEADASFSNVQQAEAIAIKEAELEASVQRVKELEQSSETVTAQQERAQSEKMAELESLQQKFHDLEAVSKSDSAQRGELISQINELKSKIQELSDAKQEQATKMLEENQALRQERDQALGALQQNESLHEEVEVYKRRAAEWEATAEDRLTEYQSTISTKNAEVQKLEAAIQKLQEQIENLHQGKRDELDEMKAAMQQAHDALIEQLNSQHHVDLETALANIKEEYSDAQAKLSAELEKTREAYAISMKHSNDLSIEVQDTRSTLQKTIDDFTAEKTSLDQVRDGLSEELQNATAKASELQEILDTCNQDSQDKERQHAASFQRVKDELKKATEELQEKTEEGMSLLSNHDIQLESLRKEHAEKIDQLASDAKAHSTQLDSLKAKQEARVQEMQEHHSRELNDAKQAYEKAAAASQKEVQELRQSLANMESELRISNDKSAAATAAEDSRDKHEAELEELRVQLAKANSDYATARKDLESAGIEQGQIESLKEQHAAQLEEHEKSYQEAKVTVAEFRAKLASAEQALEDTSQLDALKQENTRLIETYEAKLSELQREMAAEAEKHEKQRQTGADVRDKLVSQLEELERFRRDYPAAKEEAEKHQADVHALRGELQESQAELEKALSAHREERAQTAADLEEVKNELEKTRKSWNRRSRSNSGLRGDLEKWQLATENARKGNAQLKQQLEEATASIERHASRIREVEAALKATEAEIVELKTNAAKSKESPLAAGLEGSQGASEGTDNVAGSDDSVADPEDTERGSQIAGAMAGLQAQLRALESINEDMIGDHQSVPPTNYLPTLAHRSKHFILPGSTPAGLPDVMEELEDDVPIGSTALAGACLLEKAMADEFGG